jgi:signal transduction histidine kinase
VPRSLSSSADGPWRGPWLPILAVGVLGVAAEPSLYGWGDAGGWIPDLITGWTLAGCGVAARAWRRESACGLLLIASGVAWFLPDFATVGAGWVGWLAAHSLYLYRGPLIQLALTYPGGRPRGRVETASVIVAYGISLVLVVWQSAAATIAVSAGMVCVAAVGYLRAAGRERVTRRYAVATTGYLAAILAGTAVVRAAGAGDAAATLDAFEAALCAMALGLLAGLVTEPWNRVAVTDLVVEIGQGGTGTLRDELARVLGDPTLQIGYWQSEASRFIDAAGAPFEVPPDDGRTAATTTIIWGGEPVAILVHDPVVLDDPALLDAIGAAARLGNANARLQAEVTAQLSEIAASRRRIVEAEDAARSRLERRLRAGPLARLDQLAVTVEAARSSALRVATLDRIARAEDRLARTSEELKRLAQGIRPGGLGATGLFSALETLVAEFPVPVEAALSRFDAAPSVSACVYFVCSEALANVAKYASASRVWIAVGADSGAVTAVIEDDGVGGADVATGTGLRGLADRVQSLGGTLDVHSPAGRGTRVVAAIPLYSSAAERPVDPVASRA